MQHPDTFTQHYAKRMRKFLFSLAIAVDPIKWPKEFLGVTLDPRFISTRRFGQCVGPSILVTPSALLWRSTAPLPTKTPAVENVDENIEKSPAKSNYWVSHLFYPYMLSLWNTVGQDFGRPLCLASFLPSFLTCWARRRASVWHIEKPFLSPLCRLFTSSVWHFSMSGFFATHCVQVFTEIVYVWFDIAFG